jgi:hypothetical protein
LNRRRKDKPSKAREATAITRRHLLCSMAELQQAVSAIQNLGVLAAYDNLPHLRLIPCIETSAEKFIEELRDRHAQGKISNPSHVCIATTVSKELLPDPEWEERVRSALDVITIAEERGDEKVLRRFRWLMRSTGNPPGPRTKRQTHKDMIKVIKRLHAGEGMKDIAGADEKHKLSRALHTNLRRFCLEVYDEWMLWSLANPPDSPETYNELIEKHLVQSCDFDLPAEKSLAEFAFDRAKKHYHTSSR